jgi:hypothetical protein
VISYLSARKAHTLVLEYLVVWSSWTVVFVECGGGELLTCVVEICVGFERMRWLFFWAEAVVES